MSSGYPIGPPPMAQGPQRVGSNTRLLWILIGAGVLLTAAVVVAGFYFVGGFVGMIRAEVSRQTLAREYEQYFYEVYELPGEPMFSTPSTPMERVGNHTREMLRFLLTAQAYAADVEARNGESGSYYYASFSSSSNFQKAMDLLDSLAKEYANVADAHKQVPSQFLDSIREVATDAESKRFFKEQERFHLREAELYAEESKLVQNIVTLEKERANLLWANRRHLEADEFGYATLKPSAPRNARLRLDVLDSLIGAQVEMREELRRELQGAFNKFYYTVTGQREDFTD